MVKKKKQARKVRTRPAAATGGHPHHHHHHVHIHCVSCGKHLDPDVFGEPDGADWMRSTDGKDFAHCVGCKDDAAARIAAHESSGEPVERADAWH